MNREEAISLLRESRIDEWNRYRQSRQKIPSLGSADLHGAKLSGANLSRAYLNNANLFNADLGGADLRKATLWGAYLHEADLNGANLSGADLTWADLRRANLCGSDLSGANLSGVNLMWANLSEVKLRGAKLWMANLSLVDLRKADLSSANLTWANLSEAELTGVSFEHATIDSTMFCSVDLSKVQGLASIVEAAPSWITKETLALTKGHIPESFLRACGFAPWELAIARLYNPHLTGDEINELVNVIFRKRTEGPLFIGRVFISYSRKNSTFVNKLYGRLKNDGVDVRLDRHDFVAGPLDKQVHREIRLSDCVVLVLTKASIESDWVENELDMARQKQKEEMRNVLCPIALDDAWKTKLDLDRAFRSLWRTVTANNVIEFSKWKTTAFETAYEKLVRGLKIYYPPAGQSSSATP